MYCSISVVATVSANLNSVPVLNGNNFKDWKENMMIVLGCMDLDLSLRMDEPTSLTDASSADDRRIYEKWDRSNRMSLMIIKRGIPEAFRGAVSEQITNAKDFLAEIEKRFEKSDKAETSTLLKKLISMKFKGNENIREYIMEMSHIASKLKGLKLELSDDLLVHLVLISLPPKFSQFQVSYNYQKEKWSLNELISFCVQEEERLKQDKTESTHFASTSKSKNLKRKSEDAKDKGPTLQILYASAIGSLMYVQVCTRPDIAYIVGVLGRYLSNPGMDHWKAAKRVMRYLKRTKDHMLTYRRSDHLEIIGYSDSDFAGCQDSRRSTSGYVYLLGGGAISWKSAKQTLITSSTMAAKFVTCYEASNHMVYG